MTSSWVLYSIYKNLPSDLSKTAITNTDARAHCVYHIVLSTVCLWWKVQSWGRYDSNIHHEQLIIKNNIVLTLDCISSHWSCSQLLRLPFDDRVPTVGIWNTQTFKYVMPDLIRLTPILFAHYMLNYLVLAIKVKSLIPVWYRKITMLNIIMLDSWSDRHSELYIIIIIL